MGGNVPGGNFPGKGEDFPRGSLMGGNFLGGNFSGEIFLEPPQIFHVSWGRLIEHHQRCYHGSHSHIPYSTLSPQGSFNKQCKTDIGGLLVYIQNLNPPIEN